MEAVPREFVPVDFADAFIRVHPRHPCCNWMRSRLAGRGCESGDFCRRVLSDESWIFEQVGGANGDEPVSPVAIATSVAAHPRRSPFSFGGIVRMKDSEKSIALALIGLLIAYCGSYGILRATVMHFGANRQIVQGVVRIKTWVYFGSGDNWATRIASTVYFPIVRLEHACSRRVIYE